jgi:hypothetical protein
MAELEIHHESEHSLDRTGQRVGVLAALLAVALAVVTIASHRSHTAAIIHTSQSNDAWSHYQATRVKYHNLELEENLLTVLGATGPAAGKMLSDTGAEKKRYEDRGKEIQAEAQRDEKLSEADEHRALRFDMGEGLLEIGLVLSSLYFISRKNMFPVMGVAAGVAGALISATGLLI